MRRIQVYLEDDTAKAITKFASKNDLSVSNVAADILKNHFQKDNQPSDGVDPETKAYFLRIINTLNQVLMCVYDSKKSTVKSNSAEDCIKKITKQIQAFVGMPGR
ncbi:MAG: hypothetical protein A3C44_00760 [Gammaproteobacteria bacterium RIFCSPHIGHO2_02_FULL_39_13]|nr:MAG: hypothetical protein A3C44_00760 [Gammaproteobacteria bacterium RIFCSPHIGHO2_02_FULL_39_13]OGT49899.1 MAG: hypothetical protein A3E53_02965 [Gammaproteobacteria bacterium RIFCSPHIGHO2_12_FULL_39_24]